MGRIRSRQMLMRSTALAGALSVALFTAGAANAETKPITFDLPAQPLGESLRDFYRASGEQIVFSEDLVAGRTSAPLKGAYTADQALAMLLEGTNLTARRTSTGVVMIEAPQSGSAAGDGADSGTVQALIVTAQKREENIQDVPIAMSAFTQEDLTRSQVAGGPDLMTQVPNFTFTKTNFTGYSIQIRGIGTQAISATTDAAVAVAFNNTPFIRNRFFEQEFYDLERVEVLRGPQGTLYGRNATAGVVNLISAKPKFSYESRLSADLGNYNSQRFEGMINVPLVEDKVALRLAGAWTKRDGYDTNQITGNQIDGRDLWSTRLSLRFAPTDKINVNLIWEHFNENDDRLRSGKQLCKRNFPAEIGGVTVPYGSTSIPGNNNGMLYEQYFSQGCEAASLYSPDSFQAPNGLRLPYYRPLGAIGLPIISDVGSMAFDPYASTTQSRDLRVIESTVDPKYRAKTDTVELQATFDLPNSLTLTSETGYLSDVIFSSEDYNRFNTRSGAFSTASRANERPGVLDENGVFCDPQIGCADRLVAIDLSTARSHQFSQEFRVASDFDGPFNFSVGANFLRYDTEDKYYVFINTLTMYAALAPYAGFHRLISMGPLPPWQSGVSDNHECMLSGLTAPDPNGIEDVIGCVYVDPNPIGSLNDLGHNYFLSKNPYKLISYAVFGEAYYNITDRLKLTTGLRWTVDKKEAPRIPSWVLSAGTAGYPVADVIRQEWREPTGRLALDWKPHFTFTDDTLLYASYAHGYKAGGANPPANGLVMYSAEGSDKADWGLVAAQEAATAPKTFKPEFVNAFEVGSKNTLLDGRLTLNGAAFYYDYTGYQISQIVNRAAINFNFDAEIWGLELEADWRPLENLRLGFKGGYEMTRMADGSQAVDTMDRANGGKPDKNGVSWYVTGPFPTLPSNCVLPTYTVVHPNGDLAVLGEASGGGLGPCETAYVLGLDPVTNLPYVPNPTTTGSVPYGYFYPGYPGFNPATAPNGGAGFYKDLSGHELPNAPHYTATITADYTIPLPSDWLMTLHTDLYYQAEAWTRVFNTPGYDKLKAYTNVNLAAIFSNEDAGWKVMAYVKNVFDHDSITGAFLNSDDTGLTTNVFLNEPRLYGLRVTKEWTGQGWWTGANPNHTPGAPYPFTVELAGQVQRQGAPYQTMLPGFISAFPQNLRPEGLENRDLDWGDGRQLKITYRPAGSWSLSASARYGRTNGGAARIHKDQAGTSGCAIGGYYGAILCPKYKDVLTLYQTYHDWSDAIVKNREDHLVADFTVGKDVGIGGLDRSMLTAGLRYAGMNSTTNVSMDGVPDWNIPNGWAFKYSSTMHRYQNTLDARREFRGAGPMLSWDAAARLMGNEETGHVDFDWAVGGGVLFGKQRTKVKGEETASYFAGQYYDNPRVPARTDVTPINIQRTTSTSAPVVDLSLGLSYEIQRIKVGAGYRWERYFNVLDAGYQEHKSYDRTFDGPYFKIAVGFGG